MKTTLKICKIIVILGGYIGVSGNVFSGVLKNNQDLKKEVSMVETKVKKVHKAKNNSKTQQQKESHIFKVDIHEHKTLLPHNIWFIPLDKPIVSLTIVFKDVGMKNINQKHPALDLFLGAMLSKGAGQYDSYQFLEILYDNGAALNFFVDDDHFCCEISAPWVSYKEPFSLGLLALLKPKLPRGYFKTLRKENMISFEESLKDPKTHLSEASNKHFYPENHPYRASLEKIKADIVNIKTKDIREYLEFLSQQNAYVVISGPKEQEEEIVKYVETMLLQLPLQGKQTVQGVFEKNTNLKDLHVDFDIPQSIITARQKGFDRNDPHYYAKKLAFAIVAQPSLHSLLFQEIREKKGLAYSCFGKSVEKTLESFLYFYIGTRNETAKESENILKNILADIRKNGVKQRDFEITKKEYLGSLVVGLDSSSKFMSYVVNKRILGFSASETKDFLEGYEKLTYADVKKASQEIFDPQGLVFVSIGKLQ